MIAHLVAEFDCVTSAACLQVDGDLPNGRSRANNPFIRPVALITRGLQFRGLNRHHQRSRDEQDLRLGWKI